MWRHIIIKRTFFLGIFFNSSLELGLSPGFSLTPIYGSTANWNCDLFWLINFRRTLISGNYYEDLLQKNGRLWFWSMLKKLKNHRRPIFFWVVLFRGEVFCPYILSPNMRHCYLCWYFCKISLFYLDNRHVFFGVIIYILKPYQWCWSNKR